MKNQLQEKASYHIILNLCIWIFVFPKLLILQCKPTTHRVHNYWTGQNTCYVLIKTYTTLWWGLSEMRNWIHGIWISFIENLNYKLQSLLVTENHKYQLQNVSLSVKLYRLQKTFTRKYVFCNFQCVFYVQFLYI